MRSGNAKPYTQIVNAINPRIVIPGRDEFASPKSITTIGSMDSGPAPQVGNCRPKARPGMTRWERFPSLLLLPQSREAAEARQVRLAAQAREARQIGQAGAQARRKIL